MFWLVYLACFGHSRVEHWPAGHIGVVLFCLSVAAQEWSAVPPVVPVCMISDDAPGLGLRNVAAWTFENRVLRPLLWLGLMEQRLVGEEGQPEWRKQRQYRKTPLFDRALRFDVEVARSSGYSH